MAVAGRRVLLIGVAPGIDQNDATEESILHRFPSYGVHRVHAALKADPALQDAEVAMWDLQPRANSDEVAARVAEFRPDIIGFGAYVWSSPLLVSVARAVKAMRPQTTTVFGGPSADPQLFDLEPYADACDYADALVLREGEETFREIAMLDDRSRDALLRVPGVAVPRSRGSWSFAPPRVPNPDMDSIASPYQLGLMPEEHVAYLETFRGCPLSCSFCQWGVIDANRFLSTEYLVRELTAMRASRAPYTFLVDAALNLHPRAFRNLAAAEREVGFLRESALLCEVYPTHLRDEHLEFLSQVRSVQIGLGVQSLDSDTLKSASRPFKPERLREVIDQLLEVSIVDAEIIVGLPGDTPERFRRTLDAMLELPCSVRVYRCLVLPDALMKRAPEGSDVKFDPSSLMLTSCSTWSESQLRETHDYLDSLVGSHPHGALTGSYWWLYLGGGAAYRQRYPTKQTCDVGRESLQDVTPD